MVDPDHVKVSFASYAQLRQSRVSREDAWKRIRTSADDFILADRQRLIALIRDWEIIEGHRYQTNRSDDPHATMFKPPEGLREARERFRDQHSQISPSADQIEEQSEAHKLPVICPKCSTPNALDALGCTECGTSLPQTQEIDRSVFVELDIEPENTQVMRGMILKLEFPDTSEVLRKLIDREQLVIGRASTSGLMSPDIDLDPFGGQKKGVSRYHANLKCQGDTLVIHDLESLNHTHINGLRLYPHEARVLREGDELKLGQLVMRVYFEEP